MLRSILVPIDGSAFSEQALAAAVPLAARDGARLDLVMVTEPPLRLGRVHGAPALDPRLEQELHREKAAYLAALADRIQREQSVRVTAAVYQGPVAATLAGRADEGHADLLVMTTHGRGGLSRMWLGSVADALVRRVEIPVLLVRPLEGTDDAREASVFAPRRVLVALDGSEAAEGILDDAMTVAGTEGVTFIVARVSYPALVVPSAEHLGELLINEEPAVRFARATAYLEETARRVAARGLSVETRVLDGLNAPRELLECARDCGADLIALATHGRPPLARLIMGSVADSVVRTATIPVLLSRLPAAERAAAAGPTSADRQARRSALASE